MSRQLRSAKHLSNDDDDDQNPSSQQLASVNVSRKQSVSLVKKPSVSRKKSCVSLSKKPSVSLRKKPSVSLRKKPSVRSTIDSDDDTIHVNKSKSRQKPMKVLSSPKSSVPHASTHSTEPPSIGYQKLFCREVESETVRTFLFSNFEARKSNSLCITGAPGTGKTAVVQQEVSQWQEEIRASTMKHSVIMANCIKLRRASDFYSFLLDQIPFTDSGKVQKLTRTATLRQGTSSLTRSESTTLADRVEQRLRSRPPEETLLLVLDEMDALTSTNNEVLYRIFSWPDYFATRPKLGPLLIIGIYNSLDLTERVLPHLKKLSIQPTVVHFTQYTSQQLETIVRAKLMQVVQESGEEGPVEVDPRVVQLCAKKIAMSSGDVRTVMSICSRSRVLAEKETLEKEQQENASSAGMERSPLPSSPATPGLKHMLRALTEIQSSERVQVQEDLPLHQRLLLASLLLLRRCKKSADFSMSQLMDCYAANVCPKRGIKPLEFSEVLSLCTLLDARCFLYIKKPSGAARNEARFWRVVVRLDEKAVECALRDQELVRDVLDMRI